MLFVTLFSSPIVSGPILVYHVSMTISLPILQMQDRKFLTVFIFLTSISSDPPSSY